MLSIVVAAVLFSGAGSLFAATILGTAGKDTLHGTAKADRLYGRGGNDRIYGRGGNDELVGGAGNDVLVGGEGADRLVCGFGRDIAWADARDTVSKDCESVKGLPKPPLPAVIGKYCGSTSQDLVLCLEARRFGHGLLLSIRTSVETSCQPSGQSRYDAGAFYVSVRPDGSFSTTIELGGYATRIQGVFGRSRDVAAGSLSGHVAYESGGVHYECDSGAVSWTATTPPPTIAAQLGTYCGATDQGQSLCFQVEGLPKSVAHFDLVVRTTSCTPPAALGFSWKIPEAHAIRGDGTFSFTRTGSNTTSAGGFLTVTLSIQGAFEQSGALASGTLSGHLSYDAPDGTHYQCDSQTFGWSVKRQLGDRPPKR